METFVLGVATFFICGIIGGGLFALMIGLVSARPSEDRQAAAFLTVFFTPIVAVMSGVAGVVYWLVTK